MHDDAFITKGNAYCEQNGIDTTGMTAKSGSHAYSIWEPYSADLIKVGNEWKLWHLYTQILYSDSLLFFGRCSDYTIPAWTFPQKDAPQNEASV